MPVGNDKIQVFFGAPAIGAPDNLLPPIIELIDQAESTLLIATQQLEKREIVEAIVRARKRGVRCKVVLESDYMKERRTANDPWELKGSNEVNREILNVLFRARIPIRLDRSSRLVHSNFIVTDPRDEATAGIYMTSANLTPNGMDRYFNSAILVRDKKMADAFADEFDDVWDDDWKNTLTTPPEIEIDDLVVKAVFGPKHQPEMEVMKYIAKAEEDVRFAMFTFSKSSGIDDALVAAARTIPVRGVIDKNQAAQRWAATHNLLDGGVGMRWSPRTGKLHHKLLTSDQDAVLLGTFNFSASARFSHETIMVIKRNPDVPNSGLMDEISTTTRAELDRIWDASEER